MAIVIVLTFLSLLIIGLPIAFVIGLTSLIIIRIQGTMPLNAIPEYMFFGIDSFPLMAIPFFILAGEIMTETGLSKRLIHFAQVLVGRIPGALAQVNILTSIFFAGITGAAVADTAAIGSIMIPAMGEEGYSAKYSAAVTAASSCIGPIIPPSIILVVYGVAANTSISSLLLAGIIPGIIMGIAMAIIAYFQAVKYKFPKIEETLNLLLLASAFWKAIPALLMPIIIIGGILGGVFTPTEAACVAVVYSTALGFITKTLKFKKIPSICIRASVTTSIVLFIISAAKFFSIILIINDIPFQVTHFFLSLSNNPLLIIFFINILLLLVGCVMEISAACVILVPILLPVVTQIGLNPVHFGMIMCVNLAIGLATPPVGPTLFVACRIARISIEEITEAIWPFLLALVSALLLITYFPDLTMFLPNLFLRH
ncbi:TRAP transporter large permease [Candidatus Atribacteria bacterium 1244-E10-H5-B2]|jgi:C4-dicarboxylate transporter DctM subunit|nr:MAG: TRAP transporter large permease [Candidatus Atribacteria bacterium 1244-E10-H5-B2]